MNSKMTATFETRREAELVVERLVQEFKVDRSAIHVGPEGDANSAGEAPSGSDRKAASPSVEARDDAALEGRIEVQVDLDDAEAGEVRKAFREFGGQ